MLLNDYAYDMWGIFHTQLALVVSQHPGICTVKTNQIKFPSVFRGRGGWLFMQLTRA
jgi:hypothetical protein